MSDGLREIRLHGSLATKFGERHRLLVSCPAEAVRALVSTVPGFERELIDSQSDGVGYRVIVDDDSVIEPDALHLPSGMSRISIVPVVVGAGGEGGGIFMGIALIALSFVPGLNVAIWAGMSATWSSVAFSMGVSMMLSGVANMLADTPEAPKPVEPTENKPSYMFNGPVNTTQQGQCVPVAYGRVMVGGAVISAGLKTVDTA
ncbi:COG4723 Phage-related protein, tail component [uncultured Caudovirales phage]|uniref:COG4723 Phage-related protein, tail component n=1 Tax=uncultured Caudovirales phage TaxID=2100421 RepID=A0A6J5QDU3_9CAUD|nr:COG4723 Phage-related protein, tail component [uncultured Caudovirales phage]